MSTNCLRNFTNLAFSKKNLIFSKKKIRNFIIDIISYPIEITQNIKKKKRNNERFPLIVCVINFQILLGFGDVTGI